MTIAAEQARTGPCGPVGTLAAWVADARLGAAAQETRSP